MDWGALLVVVLIAVCFGGPLYLLFFERTVPVPQDWSGRPRNGVVTPGTDPLDGD